LPRVEYLAYCDPSSGAGRDSFALCIGHRSSDQERPIAVIDALFEMRPPFDPVQVITAMCAHLRAWGCNTVFGDQYGLPYISTFSRNGISYQVVPLSTSEIYLHSLPAWTSGGVAMPLLDGYQRAVDQLVSLKRKFQSGRESVSHPDRSNAHDDLATVISGVIWRCTPVEHHVQTDFGGIGVVSQPRQYGGYSGDEASETMKAWIHSQSYVHAKDGGLARLATSRRPGSVCW
jgi:hypothetical protein